MNGIENDITKWNWVAVTSIPMKINEHKQYSMFNDYAENGHLIITNLTHFESFSVETKKNNDLRKYSKLLFAVPSKLIILFRRQSMISSKH